MEWYDKPPIDDSELNKLQSAAVEEASRILVGRRLLPLYGPLKPGTNWVRRHRFENHPDGLIAPFEQNTDENPLYAEWSTYSSIPILFKDFYFDTREFLAFRDTQSPLDPSLAARAGHAVADAEDTLIFYGHSELGIEGLTNVDGSHKINPSDWNEPGNAYNDVVHAIEILLQHGHHGPYGMACAYDRYHTLIRAHQYGLTALAQIVNVMQVGVFPSLALEPGAVVIVQGGLLRVDLAVAQDLVVAYLGTEGSRHLFRVQEILIPRIKQANAIVLL